MYEGSACLQLDLRRPWLELSVNDLAILPYNPSSHQLQVFKSVYSVRTES